MIKKFRRRKKVKLEIVSIYISRVRMKKDKVVIKKNDDGYVIVRYWKYFCIAKFYSKQFRLCNLKKWEEYKKSLFLSKKKAANKFLKKAKIK